MYQAMEVISYSLSLFFLLLSILIFPTLTAAAATAITLPLAAFPPGHDHHSTQVNLLATESLARAHHLKQTPKLSIKAPLYPHSYGAYSISLGFGAPPQTLPFIFDTGSSLVWSPCTSRFFCFACSFPKVDTTNIPTFIPNLSSSTHVVLCRDPKCKWVFGSSPKLKNCSVNAACPAYLVQYGSGATAGILLAERVNLVPGKNVPGFLIGCSILSIHLPVGIVGFGRGPQSMPSQLGLKKFSHCLLSRRFDDKPVSSPLVLTFKSGSVSNSTNRLGFNYTPFRKNPSFSNPAFKEYYYVTIRKIVVGDKTVKNIPYKYLVPGSGQGHGGTIIDSGSTFTFMEKPVYEAVTQELEKQMANYRRAVEEEVRTGLRPCFDISKAKEEELPKLIFKFKGGAELKLQRTNFFWTVGDGHNGVLCMAILTNKVVGNGTFTGPAIILGAFQQQNFEVEYDLENSRLGFRKRNCLGV